MEAKGAAREGCCIKHGAENELLHCGRCIYEAGKAAKTVTPLNGNKV